jgi:outer membrane lipid asymmetry maintenance protein MlaD
MNRSTIDLWVGVFVVLGIGALLFLALKVGNLATFSDNQTYLVQARFANIGGLKVRAPIKSAGVVVGRVADIRFDNETYEALVSMTLGTSYQFPRDTTAKILTSGILGEQYIGLEAGGDGVMLKNGDRVRLTQSAVVLENLIGVYLFNEVVEEAVARPVATAYRDVVHSEIRDRVRNFFSNIGDVFIGANNLLQGKFFDGFEDFARVVFNTSFGLFGIHDVASDMGIEKHNEDFGQTFGRWGIGEGPYLVLPILGSSSVRDGVGTALDYYTDPLGELRPIRVRNSLGLLRLVGARADLLDASRILEQAALDKYVFQRDAYFQRRRSLVYDGRAPRERYDDAPGNR